MEHNFTDNDFEQFLRDSIEEYKMVPSRRVWYGIYNNVHPSKRWPSLAVCLLILTTFLYIGISNNNSISQSFLKSKAENINALAKAAAQQNNLQKNSTYKENLLYKKPTTTSINNNTAIAQLNPIEVVEQEATVTTADFNSNVTDNGFVTNLQILANDTTNFNTESRTKISIKAGNITTTETTAEYIEDTFTTPDDNDIKTNSNVLADLIKNDKTTTTTTPNKNILLNALAEKAWIEDYAFKNKPKQNKFKQNAAINYYITPSFGYRGFAKKVNTKQSSTLLLSNSSLSNRNIEDDPLIDGAALNVEAGVAVKYKISKKIRLIAGVQANYTNYVSNATALGHPTQTYLAVNSDVNAARYSDYATKAGNTKLNKTTIQVALPIGADYKIIGKGKVKWYVGSTLQPTYVLSGSALVLSNDGKNYITETPLLRRFNVNAAVETFATFKPSNNVTLSVGPQFRYQLLSTYKSQYNYTEKLYNVGIKIGITTVL